MDNAQKTNGLDREEYEFQSVAIPDIVTAVGKGAFRGTMERYREYKRSVKEAVDRCAKYVLEEYPRLDSEAKDAYRGRFEKAWNAINTMISRDRDHRLPAVIACLEFLSKYCPAYKEDFLEVLEWLKDKGAIERGEHRGGFTFDGVPWRVARQYDYGRDAQRSFQALREKARQILEARRLRFRRKVEDLQREAGMSPISRKQLLEGQAGNVVLERQVGANRYSYLLVRSNGRNVRVLNAVGDDIDVAREIVRARCWVPVESLGEEELRIDLIDVPKWKWDLFRELHKLLRVYTA